jgi:hypothetical protein
MVATPTDLRYLASVDRAHGDFDAAYDLEWLADFRERRQFEI